MVSWAQPNTNGAVRRYGELASRLSGYIVRSLGQRTTNSVRGNTLPSEAVSWEWRLGLAARKRTTIMSEIR